MSPGQEQPPSDSQRWRSSETRTVAILVAAGLIVGAFVYRNERTAADTERLREDFKLISLGINSFHEEQGTYPSPDRPSGSTRTKGTLPTILTTPVAYLNRLPIDPDAPGNEFAGLYYVKRDDSATTAGDPGFDALVVEQLGEPARDVDYAFWSRGPDGDIDTTAGPDGAMSTIHYDPTNGARSNGDILFWGPAIGKRRNPWVGTRGEGRGGLR